MPLRKPEKSEWRAYCAGLSKNLANIRSEQVTASLVVNKQVVAERVPLLEIIYEPKRDLFEIMLQDLKHWIHRPATLYVDEGPKGIAALEIIDAAGNATQTDNIAPDQTALDDQLLMEVRTRPPVIAGLSQRAIGSIWGIRRAAGIASSTLRSSPKFSDSKPMGHFLHPVKAGDPPMCGVGRRS